MKTDILFAFYFLLKAQNRVDNEKERGKNMKIKQQIYLPNRT